jgi:hypothetical protein
MLTLVAAVFCCATLTPLDANALAPAKDPHHVMWTNKKGKAKCCNKGTKAKAEQCAEKMKGKGATNVQVMAGKCSAM